MENQITDLFKSIKTLSDMLIAIHDLESKDVTAKGRDGHIRNSLNRSNKIANSCLLLCLENQHLATEILLRSMAEDLIKLHWVTMAEDNAQYIKSNALDELKKMAKLNAERGILKFYNEETGEDDTESYTKSAALSKSVGKKSIQKMAEESGIIDLYNILYRSLSMQTHGTRENETEQSDETIVFANLNTLGVITKVIGNISMRWLLSRNRPTNEELRILCGFTSQC